MKNPTVPSFHVAAFRTALLLVLLAGLHQNASAANYTWNATSGNWSVGPWTGGTPSSNQDNALFFNVTTATRSSVNDLGVFSLNSIALNNTSTGATARNLSVSGNALNFVANSSSALPTLTVNNSSTTSPTVGTVTMSNDFTVTDALTIINSGTALGTISGNITNTGGITVSGSGTGNLAFSTSRVVSGNGGVTFNAGSSTTTFGGSNTYLGGTTITSGTVQIQSNTAFSTGALAVNGGSLDLFNRTLTVGALSGGSSGVITNSHATSSASLTTNSSADSTYAGVINDGTGSGSIALIKQGTGTLTLSGANTYAGTTTISGGTLQFAKQASLYNATTGSWTKTNIIVGSGATLAVSVGDSVGGYFDAAALNTLQTNLLGSNAASQGFQAGSFIAFDTTNAAGGTFTQGNAITNSSGAGGGAVGLKKTGSGTLILDKANLYTGATTVTAGTLIINGSTASASSVSVNSAATLGGSGTINGATTINGILAPGNSIGTLTVSNEVTWNFNDNWKFELGTGAASLAAANAATDSDLLNITGAFAFTKGTGTTFTFDFLGTGTAGWYKLVDFNTTSFSAGDFGIINLGSGLSGTFTVDGGTSALYLNVVPEPATWALMALSLTTVVVLRRRVGRE